LAFAATTRQSTAAYTESTTNGASSFGSGSVALSDDDLGGVRFNLTSVRHEVSTTRCVSVTYSGSLTAAVRVYAQVTGGTGLAAYGTISVERGSGGSFADCSGFVLSETLYTGTVGGLAAAASSFATGLGTWTPSGGAPSGSTYRMTVGVPFDPAARLKSVDFTLLWEAQSV
jgi:hypothetical protein